ncbi:MAG: glutaredoxin family protein [Patescibacteria group bacterium]
MDTDENIQVKVFSAQWCGFCKMVKAYLSDKGVEFTVVDIDEEPDAAMWLREKTGQAGVPVTMFGGKDLVIGFDRQGIDGYLREYKLI